MRGIRRKPDSFALQISSDGKQCPSMHAVCTVSNMHDLQFCTERVHLGSLWYSITREEAAIGRDFILDQCLGGDGVAQLVERRT